LSVDILLIHTWMGGVVIGVSSYRALEHNSVWCSQAVYHCPVTGRYT